MAFQKWPRAGKNAVNRTGSSKRSLRGESRVKLLKRPVALLTQLFL